MSGAILSGTENGSNLDLEPKMGHTPDTPAVPMDRKRFEKAPCYVCGYNGSGYYQPASHPCAKLYHADTPAVPEPIDWKGGRFTGLPERLRRTTERMASVCAVDMSLWNAHSNAALDAALKIEALERDMQALADRLAECEAALDSEPCGSGFWRFWCEKATRIALRNVDLERRATTAEAALAEARELVIELLNTAKSPVIQRIAREWLSANPTKETKR